MLAAAILQLSLIFALQPIAAQESTISWGVVTHQTVVVKATSLIPAGLKRQILRHRVEVLGGCGDALDGMSEAGNDAEILAEYRSLVADLRATAPFARICRRLGRLSVLLGESDSPLLGLEGPEANAFAEFLAGELQNLPLVINTDGEQFLADGDIAGYLNWRRERNATRRQRLIDALHNEREPMDWHEQRSAAWGAAVLCYNDLVLDTARLWLRAWEEGGGCSADAPYFRLGSDGKK